MPTSSLAAGQLKVKLPPRTCAAAGADWPPRDAGATLGGVVSGGRGGGPTGAGVVSTVGVVVVTAGGGVVAVGAAVGADGTTAFDAVEAAPAPATFLAVTVNVYVVPLLSPVTVQESAPVVVHDPPPPDAVTV
jgi:hypothetical protein